MSINEIGRRLKQARLSSGLTQADVARRLGVTYQAISNYERGTNKVDTDTLVELCGIYNVRVSQVLTGPDCTPVPQDREYPATTQKLVVLAGELNEEGREKLLDYADDLVSSGKYCQRGQNGHNNQDN